MKRRVAQFLTATPCPVCHGKCLKPEALTVTSDGLDAAEFSALTLNELASLLTSDTSAAGTDRDSAGTAAPSPRSSP